MNLLTVYKLKKEKAKVSPVETWRIDRPIKELAKHTDWQIDKCNGIFEKAKKAKDIPEGEMQERIDYFKNYDLVWNIYHTNLFAHTFTMIAQDKIATKFVMDIDDNVFDIDPINPIHMTLDKKYLTILKGIAIDTNYVTTTTETLAEVLREQRYYKPKESVVVIPNLISTAVYKPCEFDNGDKIVIGYLGGSSHYYDLHKTGIYEALEKIMHEYKNVYIKTAGMFIDKYLPKARYEFIFGKRKADDWYKLYSTLNYDICLAPIQDTPFSVCKSNIKWQEYSLIGSPTIASNIGPYKDTIKHGSDGLLVENTSESWYNAIKMLIENETLRRKIGQKAKTRVIEDFSLEKNWHLVQEGLEKIQKLDKTKNKE